MNEPYLLWTCDRCGLNAQTKEEGFSGAGRPPEGWAQHQFKIIVTDQFTPRSADGGDLCPNCVASYRQWKAKS